jgi:TM2 domain-containing membrane protein YozV
MKKTAQKTKEEKMGEKNVAIENRKSPVLAAIISAIFPGAGFFYIGNFLKGIAYIIIFAILIVLEVHSSEYGTRELEIVVFGLLIAGFYIFQIIDSFNDARAVQYRAGPESTAAREEMSLAGSVLVLVLGIVFLLINFDVLSYGQVIRLWPLVLIGLGLKFILNYYDLKKKEVDDEQA